MKFYHKLSERSLPRSYTDCVNRKVHVTIGIDHWCNEDWFEGVVLCDGSCATWTEDDEPFYLLDLECRKTYWERVFELAPELATLVREWWAKITSN